MTALSVSPTENGAGEGSMVKGRYARALVHGLMVVGLALPGSGGVARGEVTLFENLGSLHRQITTTSDLAQTFFDQGLRLVYAFNHEEAIAAFTGEPKR